MCVNRCVMCSDAEKWAVMLVICREDDCAFGMHTLNTFYFFILFTCFPFLEHRTFAYVYTKQSFIASGVVFLFNQRSVLAVLL